MNTVPHYVMLLLLLLLLLVLQSSSQFIGAMYGYGMYGYPYSYPYYSYYNPYMGYPFYKWVITFNIRLIIKTHFPVSGAASVNLVRRYIDAASFHDTPVSVYHESHLQQWKRCNQHLQINILSLSLFSLGYSHHSSQRLPVRRCIQCIGSNKLVQQYHSII